MEKPILFSTEMVKAILDGRKTQTRRVIKPQPRSIHPYFEYLDNGLIHFDNGETGELIKMPYQPGDVLWVRETWNEVFTPNWEHAHYMYKADEKEEQEFERYWRPSIHMPREAARIFLKVTNVRMERLQDITEDDARAEGAQYEFPPSKRYKEKESKWVSGHCSECVHFDLTKGIAKGPCSGNYEGQQQRDGSSIGCTFVFKLKSDNAPEPAIFRFRNLWDYLNAKRGYGWDANPWVWVIEFERGECKCLEI